MFRLSQILVSAIVLGSVTVCLSACGQQGPLYLPTPTGLVPATPPASAATSAPQ